MHSDLNFKGLKLGTPHSQLQGRTHVVSPSDMSQRAYVLDVVRIQIACLVALHGPITSVCLQASLRQTPLTHTLGHGNPKHKAPQPNCVLPGSAEPVCEPETALLRQPTEHLRPWQGNPG